MAPATNATTGSEAWNTTTTAPWNNTTYAAWNFTTTTPYPVFLPDEGGVYYWSWYSGYVLYVLLILMFIVALPLAAVMAAKRKREAAARSLALQRQRARRQMEINVTSNCTGGGSSGGVSNVCLNTQDEISVLPKTLDLPPSYDEAAFSEQKQGSTLTIATTLEASNPNLAVGINEPPPVYEANMATSTTTTTTTTTFLVNGHPPVM
ncbi:uncharacterized protein [Drosophila kikkawai]|uniref:Uncharacterized protein isoform X1 n=2 Tax=Drosophila kikkawai TaxID=30033 RepID=A0A6P4IQY2_DROKI|nr:uncharacterized protein LOC108076508 isoform X1 [Drosophila kikkawai]XP_017024898.1 uncharacterized protein LOC108076508 isoform X1 [Drosophila kikkawai]